MRITIDKHVDGGGKEEEEEVREGVGFTKRNVAEVVCEVTQRRYKIDS